MSNEYKLKSEPETLDECPFCGNDQYLYIYSPDEDGDPFEDSELWTCMECKATLFIDIHSGGKTWHNSQNWGDWIEK